MKPQNPNPSADRPSNAPTPEIEPNPGTLPKQFPQSQPLSDDGLEAAKKDSSEANHASSGSGEDPFVESGLPENDPERPRETEEEKSLE